MSIHLFFFTDAITPQSRVVFDRHIGTRFGEDAPRRFDKIAPFLRFDSDPYLAVVEGRLLWIQDAYTISNMFPYSMPYGRPYVREMNYIRNSVKVVLDAYNGSVTFYAWDMSDPLLKTYMAIFPHLFKSADEISPALRAHLRYPIDLFDIQAALYNTYHMTTPIVFYNREDVWEIPTEYYGTVDRPIRMRPYYVMARLPDEDREEYILMLPATPSNKPNMIGWIFARCDGENYGRLVVYKLPKETLIYGPDAHRTAHQSGYRYFPRNYPVGTSAGQMSYAAICWLFPSAIRSFMSSRFICAHPNTACQSSSACSPFTATASLWAKISTMRSTGFLQKQRAHEFGIRKICRKTSKHLPRQAYRQFETAQKHLQAGAFSDYGQSVEALRQTLRRMNESDPRRALRDTKKGGK